MAAKRKNPSPGGSNSNSPAKKKRVHTRSKPSLTDPSLLPPRAIDGIHRAVLASIDTGKRNAFRALKKARGFENRKLPRRIKSAR